MGQAAWNKQDDDDESYRWNWIEIHGSSLPRHGNGFRVDGIPAVVGTTSTGVPWEWGLPLPEWYIIFGATVILSSIMHFIVTDVRAPATFNTL